MHLPTRRAVTTLAVGAVLTCAASAQAQGVRSLTLRLDNDILALRGGGAPPDYDYTHGLTISAELASPPRWVSLTSGLPACESPDGASPDSPSPDDAAPCSRTRVSLGQRIYTPRRDAPTPLPGERPYAAWLYAGAEVTRVRPGRERSLAVEVGVTGPAALGEPVQNGVHRLLGSRPQEGWAHQLGTEPGVLLRYEEARPVERMVPGVGAVRLTPSAVLTLGNVRTSAGLGASAHLGTRDGTGLHGRLAARGEWVARDLFLDGNTSRGNSLAERRPWVGEGEIGVGWRGRRWAGEYRFTLRSREYHAQPRGHGYGSLSVSLLR